MREIKLLNVGDKIFELSHGKPRQIITITRVTKTMAFYKIREDYEGRLYREISDYGHISKVGGTASYSFTSYQEYTDELNSKFGRLLLEDKFYQLKNKFNPSTVSDEVLNKLIELLETKH